MRIAVFSVLLASAAFAGEPTDVIKHANAELQDLLTKDVKAGSPDEKALTDRLDKDLQALLDVRDLTKRALVDHTADVSSQQLDDLVDTLQKLIHNSYLKELRSRAKYEVVYDGEEAKDGGDVLVKTEVKAERDGRPATIHVDYLLHKDGATWKDYDVITDDVSMLENYRSQFNRIIAKDGVTGLLARMKKKLASESAE